MEVSRSPRSQRHRKVDSDGFMANQRARYHWEMRQKVVQEVTASLKVNSHLLDDHYACGSVLEGLHRFSLCERIELSKAPERPSSGEIVE